MPEMICPSCQSENVASGGNGIWDCLDCRNSWIESEESEQERVACHKKVNKTAVHAVEDWSNLGA